MDAGCLFSLIIIRGKYADAGSVIYQPNNSVIENYVSKKSSQLFARRPITISIIITLKTPDP